MSTPDLNVSTSPEPADNWLEKGMAHQNAEELPQAIAAFKQATLSDPNSVQAWYQLSKMYVFSGEYGEAIQAFVMAADLEPGLIHEAEAILVLKRAINGNVQVLLHAKRPDDIERMFQDLALKPAISADWTFQRLWANALILVGKNADAIIRLQSLTEHEPQDGNAQGWFNYGTALSALGNFSRALAALDRAREIDSSLEQDLEYRVMLAPLLTTAGRHDEAIAVGRSLIEILPKSPMLRLNFAIALTAKGRNQEALAELDKAIEFSAESATPELDESTAQIQRGRILLAEKRPEEALRAYARAAELSVKSHNITNEIAASIGQGFALQSQALADPTLQEIAQTKALAAMTKATELSTKVPPGSYPALAWWGKGSILSWLGRTEEALNAFQIATTNHPEAVHMQLSLGKTYDQLQDHERSAETFAVAKQLARLPDEKFEACLGYGIALHRLERYEKAIDAYREAIAAKEENERILELLGNVYSALGRREAALMTFRRGWSLGVPKARSTSLAVGISTELLAQKRYTEAQSFLAKAQNETTFTGDLYLRQGIALYGLKEHNAAVKAFRKAAKLGVETGNEYAERLEGGSGPNKTWIDFWFGNTKRIRRGFGVALIVLLVLAMMPAFLKVNSLSFIPFLDLSKDWKVMLIPIILLTALLLLPILRRVSVKGMEFDVSNPEPQIERKDLGQEVDAFLRASATVGSMPGAAKP